MVVPNDSFGSFERQRSELLAALSKARHGTSVEAVHELRKSLRRAEALLHKLQDDHPSALRFRKRSQQTLERLQALRRVAGKVRDRDVQRERIAALAAHPGRGVLQPERAALRDEAERFDRRLHKARRRAAGALAHTLEAQDAKIERGLAKTALAMHPLRAAATDHPRTAWHTAQDWLRRAAPLLATPDPDNLHELRKRTKEARYLAELEPANRAAKALAARLHRLQDALGEWHDWALLSERSRKVLGRKAALSAACESATKRTLRQALRETAQLRAARGLG